MLRGGGATLVRRMSRARQPALPCDRSDPPFVPPSAAQIIHDRTPLAMESTTDITNIRAPAVVGERMSGLSSRLRSPCHPRHSAASPTKNSPIGPIVWRIASRSASHQGWACATGELGSAQRGRTPSGRVARRAAKEGGDWAVTPGRWSWAARDRAELRRRWPGRASWH
jgi:hypothetical protein